MTTAAYERGRRDAGEGAHVRSNDEDYLRGYAEGIIGIPGSPSIEVHIARSDAWAGRPPSRTDAAYLAAYVREIQDYINRACYRQDDLERAEGLRDAVQRRAPQHPHPSLWPYLRGYAEAAAVLLGASAKVPAPAPDPAQAVQRAQADALDERPHQEGNWEYRLHIRSASDSIGRLPLSVTASYADAAMLGQPPAPAVLPKAAPARLTPKTAPAPTVAPPPAKTEPAPPKGPTVGPRETLLEVD